MENFAVDLKIIYIENRTSSRNLIEEELGKKFNKIYVLEDGEKAITLFNSLREKNIKVDAIISDIDLPNMSGIELLRQIRIIDEKIPFIFTLENLKKEYLLETNGFDNVDYIFKPIDVDYIVKKLVKECKTLRQLEMIDHQKKEHLKYIEVLDSVANVLKIDSDGIITYVNDNFCMASKYKRDEVIGKTYELIRHPDISQKTIDMLWQTISSGKIWKGEIKNRAKDGSTYFVKSNIIPCYDENDEKIIEYIGIRFIVTDEVKDKREFKRKVIQNVSKSVLERQKQEGYIQKLEKKLKDENSSRIRLFFQNKLEIKKKKIDKLNAQVFHYEERIKELNEKMENIINISNKKIKLTFDTLRDLRHSNKQLTQDVSRAHYDLEIKNVVIEKLEDKISEQSKIINNLKDLINRKNEEKNRLKRGENKKINSIFSLMKKK